jgi:hypothetical protein
MTTSNEPPEFYNNLPNLTSAELTALNLLAAKRAEEALSGGSYALQDLTNVSSTAPGSGDNGKALVWDNTTGKWESGNISRGNINLVNGGQSFNNATGSPSTNQSYIAVNYSGVPPSPLTVSGAFVPAYGQFAVIANGPSDPRAGFSLFGSGVRSLFFLGGSDASVIASQTGVFLIGVQNPSNLAQSANLYFYPSGELFIDKNIPSTSTTTGNIVVPGGIGIGGNGTFGGYLRIVNSSPPANSGDTGLAGQMAWDSNHFYVCIAANTWKRVALSTW